MKARLIAATCAAASLLAAAGCGSSTARPVTTTPVTTTPVTTATSTTATSTTAARPSTPASSQATSSTTAPTASPPVAQATRIVSLSATATEMLYAIGAGDRIVSVDTYSNYPAEVLHKPHELSGLEPNVEAIAAYKPDLVVIADDTAGLKAQLASLKIPVWIGAAATSFDDTYAQIEQLGAITGHVADAARLVAKMHADVAAAVASATAQTGGRRRDVTYYHELDPTYYSVTAHTFLGFVYALFGLTNIADQSEAGNDYPQLSSELIVQRSPDLIFLADTKCCQQTPAAVAARPGWSAIAAVRNNGVIAMDDDIASRWGPRIVDYVKAVAAALAAVPSTPVETGTATTFQVTVP